MVSRSTSPETPRPITETETETEAIEETKDWDSVVPSRGIVIGPEDLEDAERPPVWVSEMDELFGERPCLAIVTGYTMRESSPTPYRLVAKRKNDNRRFQFARHWIIPLGMPREYMEHYKNLAPSAFDRLIEPYRGGEHGSDYLGGETR